MCQSQRSGTSLACKKGVLNTHPETHSSWLCLHLQLIPHTLSVVPGNRQGRMDAHPCLWQTALLSQQVFSLCLTSTILLAEPSPPTATALAPQICSCNPSTEQSLRDRVIQKNHNSAWSDTGEWTHLCCILPYTPAVNPPQAWIGVSEGVPGNRPTNLDYLAKASPLGT